MVLATPIGRLELVDEGGALVAIRFDAPVDGSPEHERGGSALLDARFTELGVGVAYGGRYGAYWAQALGSSGAVAGVPADGAPPLEG